MNKIKIMNLLDKGVYIGCQIYLIGLMVFLYNEVYNLFALNVGSQLPALEVKQYVQDAKVIISSLEIMMVSMIVLICGVLLRSAYRYYATVFVFVPTMISLCYMCVNYR